MNAPPFKGGVHFTDANALNAPAVLLAETVAVLEAAELEPGMLRLLMTTNRIGPAALRVVDMNITTGALIPVASGGFISAPSLSPDGQYIAGYRYLALNESARRLEGPLTIRNLVDGQQVVLSAPSPVWGFQWQGQR
jgi:hypothetical protein